MKNIKLIILLILTSLNLQAAHISAFDNSHTSYGYDNNLIDVKEELNVLAGQKVKKVQVLAMGLGHNSKVSILVNNRVVKTKKLDSYINIIDVDVNVASKDDILLSSLDAYIYNIKVDIYSDQPTDDDYSSPSRMFL